MLSPNIAATTALNLTDPQALYMFGCLTETSPHSILANKAASVMQNSIKAKNEIEIREPVASELETEVTRSLLVVVHAVNKSVSFKATRGAEDKQQEHPSQGAALISLPRPI